MPLFALISPEDNPALEKAVSERFKDRYYKIAPGQFVVSEDNATTQSIFEGLGFRGGTLGLAIILPITNYAGWHSQNLWEWISAQSKRPPAPAAAG